MNLTLKLTCLSYLFLFTLHHLHAQKSPRPPHEVVAELQNEKAKLEQEVKTLARENGILRRQVAEYQRQIRKLNQENLALRRELQEMTSDKVKKDSLERIIRQSEARYKLYEDSISLQQIEINRLRQDSTEAENRFNKFKNNHFFITDDYIVPYDVPVGPIPFGGRNEGYPLYPDRSTGEFLNKLRFIGNTHSEVTIVVTINGPLSQKEDIEDNIRAELEGYCKNCRFNLQFNSSGRSSQISFVFQKDRP